MTNSENKSKNHPVHYSTSPAVQFTVYIHSLMCHKSNVNVNNLKEFLLLGDKPDRREYHIP